MKKIFVAAILMALMAFAIGCGADTVAEVNGTKITTDDLERAMKETKANMKEGFPEEGSDEFRELERDTVERLVNEEILWAEAEKLGITVSDDEIEEQIKRITQQVGDEEKLEVLLAEQGLTQADFREQQRKSLLFQKLYPEVTKDTPKVSDEEALKYYNENTEQFQKPERRKVRHILLKDEATALQVKARLDAGEDFAAVAREVSEDPGSKDKGGELGEAASQGSGFVPEFEQAMNQLAVGQISGPVQSNLPGFGTGFHIIQVTEIKAPGVASFEEIKEEIKQQLEFNVNQRKTFEDWFEAAKQNYTITYSPGFEPAVTTPETTGTQTVPQTQTIP